MADPDGQVISGFGDTERPFWVRSSAKPFQATVATELGADLPPEHLALACASHDGTSTHVAIVRAILADGGLSESDLACPPDRPLSTAADRSLASGGVLGSQRVFHTCSGKHAAFLRACAASGWPTTSYLDPSHPLQREVSDHLLEVGAVVDRTLGVDGCGAPVHVVTVARLTSAYARLADDRHRRVWDAMSRYPALVSGTGNVDEVVAVGLDAVAKRGAEGLLAIAVRGRGSMVVKCWDGAFRAVSAAASRALRDAGWIDDRSTVVPGLDQSVLGGGQRVGSVDTSFTLEPV